MKTYVHSAKTARKLDEQAQKQYGIPPIVLMENAARAIGRVILEQPDAECVDIICGPGNNGADGMAIARVLALAGREVCVYIDKTIKPAQEYKTQLDIITQMKLPIRDIRSFAPKGDLILDAMFGSGLSRPVRTPWKEVIQKINADETPVWCVDIPSGLEGSSGRVLGWAVKASRTLALDCLKSGFFLNDGPYCTGKVDVLDIAIPEELHLRELKTSWILNENDVSDFLPERPIKGHKGMFGRVLLAGGSRFMQGAVTMAASSACRSGCGLVMVYAPESAALSTACKLNMPTIYPALEKDGFFACEAVEGLLDRIKWCDAAGSGMGIGQSEGSWQIVKTLLDSSLPLVLDADALNLISQRELPVREAPTILTPHLKEFSRMCQLSVEKIEEDPFTAAAYYIQQHPGITLVLKSNWTLIADGKQFAFLNLPCSALAKGGSGDVLSGLISGLLGYQKDPFKAACLGVWIHNAAGHLAGNPYTCIPDDLIHNFTPVFDRLMELKQASLPGKFPADFES